MAEAEGALGTAGVAHAVSAGAMTGVVGAAGAVGFAMVPWAKAKAKTKAKAKARERPLTVRRSRPAPNGPYPPLPPQAQRRPLQYEDFELEVRSQLARLALPAPMLHSRILTLEPDDVQMAIDGVINAMVARLQAGQTLQFRHRFGDIVIAPQSVGDGAHNVNFTMSEGLRRFIFLRPAR